ncbi:uncharacterized protein AC631_02848 [Debaryomyces fabryi]|uniref:CMP/dCMP-type deaminase domain-containing protein n=1 Tax=Debaryomyces fabryi TaxID=58627 RepID=A0A0V1PZ76_9ASCO|nr:uncharacterized protein AC631_02848 [Debaryomyces fabryi]KSA01420.1 hypothetical protein AC631_02848 [Debaryomyces fabryi]CUM52858.1 unnamed protein product [Debaryomyces fabryi]
MVFKNFNKINSFIADISKLVKIIKTTSKQMGKNKENSVEHVDLENGVIHGVLKQIKYSTINTADPKIPILTNVWCCDISPSQSKALITFIRQFITPNETLPLVHVKRFNKVTENKASDKPKSILRTILCSADLFQNEAEILNLLEEHGSDLDVKSFTFYQKQIPRYPATTKEISQEWTSNYWPMSWKGNPNHQALKAANFNISRERAMINKLLDALQEYRTTNSTGVPVVTIIAKESKMNEDHEILTVNFDNRNNHPLEHSVMKSIEEIAKNETSRRCNLQGTMLDHADKNDLNYLCHNLLVYTTHEPCVMCSMALVHSRIGRIIYMKDIPETGGLSSNYQLGDRDGLNWKYDIWKWIGEEELSRLDSIVGSTEINSRDPSAINI